MAETCYTSSAKRWPHPTNLPYNLASLMIFLTSHCLKWCPESTFTYFSVQIYRFVYSPSSSNHLLGTICWWWWGCGFVTSLNLGRWMDTWGYRTSVHTLKQAPDMSGMKIWGKKTLYLYLHMAHLIWGTESTGSYWQNAILEMQKLIKEGK